MACRDWCSVGPPPDDRDNPEVSLTEWEIDVAKFSAWFADKVLSVYDRSDAPEIPSQFYIAMHSTTSSTSSAGTEISDTNYARQPVSFAEVSQVERRNTGQVQFPSAASLYEVASFSIWDAETSGNYYGYGNLAAAVTVRAGSVMVIPSEKIILRFS